MEDGTRNILVNAISVFTGGAQTFLVNLLPLLASITPNWNYHLLVRQERKRLYQDLPANVSVGAIPNKLIDTPLKRLKVEHFVIPRHHRRRHYSLHFQIDEMLSPVISVLRVPSIAVFHTIPAVLQDASTADSWLFRKYAQYVRKIAAVNVSIPVTVSHYAKSEFAVVYPSAATRFRVVYHGVDSAHFSPGPPEEAFLQQLGIKRPFVLSVSNRFEWKNYYRLIEAYRHLIDSAAVPFDLVLVGEEKKSAEEKHIRKYLNAHGLRSRVHLLDFVSHTDLPNLYRAADIYVFPSLRETFGMTVLEAMACGLPAACAQCGPLPEIAGEAAHYFDPLDVGDIVTAVNEIYSGSGLRRRLIGRGLERAQTFTWSRAAASYRDLILEATAVP